MKPPVGVWLVGARGAVSVCTLLGAYGLRTGSIGPTGLVTAKAPLAELPLPPFRSLVFGGHEVRSGSLPEAAADYQRTAGVPSPTLVRRARRFLAAVDTRVRPGAEVTPTGRVAEGRTPLGVVERLARDLQRFREETGAVRLVVVHLATTEPPLPPEWQRLSWVGLRRRLGRRRTCGLRASLLYAAAAFAAGAAFVNFTPSPGTELPALAELAALRGLPHAGKDGKTGETFVKTVLAPALLERHLRILTWYGYNLLGNRDGEALNDPERRRAKECTKARSLAELNGGGAATRVTIHWAPSLHDWKTAWDFVHFEGFLGARMSLQFIWQGCDSALAAPLVLDLIRLAALALARGEAGPLVHLASFFKEPLGTREQSFPRQYALLEAYARRVLAQGR